MAGKSLVARYLLDPAGVKSGVGVARGELSNLDDDTGKLSAGVDQASTRMGKAFQGIGGSLENLGIPFAGSIGKFGEKFDEADTKGKSFFQTLSGVGGAAVLGIGAAAIAAGAEGVKLAEGFDTATGQIASSAGISVKSAKTIGDAFLNTAGTTTFSGTQMAQAYAGVAGQLGTVQGHALNAQQALAVMTASTNLAEASGSDLNSSTSALSATMQAYGLDAGQAAGASDVLFNTSRDMGVGIGAVAGTFQKLHSTLGAVSPSLDQVGGIMVDLANHGETGRKALSAVNTALNGLLTPSKAAVTAQQQLGVSVFDASGKFVGFSNLIGQLQPKLAGMSEQQQLATLKSIGFGTANKALLTTIMSGPQAFDAASAAVSRAKSAHDAAEKATDNLRGQTEKLKATAEDLGTKLGEALIPKLEMVAQETSKVIGWFMKHKGAAEALAGVVGGVLAVAMGAFAINTGAKLVKSLQSAGEAVGKLGSMMLEKLVPTSAAVSDAFAVEGEAAEGAGVATESAFGPIGLILAAVSIAAMLLVTHWKQVSKFLLETWHDISSVAKSVWGDITSFFKKWGEDLLLLFLPVVGVPVFLATHWHKVEADAKAIWGDITGFFTKIPGDIMKALSALVADVEGLAKDAWNGFLKALNAGEALLKAYFVTIPMKILTWLGDATQWLLKTADNAVHGFWNGFLNAETFLMGQIRTLPGKVAGWLSDAGSWLLGVGAQVISGLWNGVVAGWSALGNIGNTIFGWVKSAIGDASGWLYNEGMAVITGFWNGLKAAWSAVTSWLGGLAGQIKNLKGPIDYDRTILEPHGNAIMEGLANGLQQGYAGKVAPYLKGVAGQIAGTTFASSASGPGGGSAALAPSGVPGAPAAGAATVNIYLTVQGNVTTENDLFDAFRRKLLNVAQVNGTLLGVNT